MSDIDVSLKDWESEFDKRIQNLIVKHTETIKKLDDEIEDLDVELGKEEMKHDRAENASYHIAIDSRTMKSSMRTMLQQKIDDMKSEIGIYKPTGFVNIGSILEIRILSIDNQTDINNIIKGRDKFIIKVVKDGMSEAKSGLISADSPVASAMIGHKAKDTITTKTTFGDVKFIIERVY